MVLSYNNDISQMKKYMIRRIATLAWPVVVEMIFLVIGGVLTTAMVGRFGPVVVAAVGLATMLQITCAMVISSAGTGAGALVARNFGAKNILMAQKIAGQALVIGFLSSILGALFCYFAGTRLVKIASPDANVIALASEFITIMVFFLPFLAITSVCLAAVRGTGKTRVAMLVAIIGQFISLSVTYSLLFIFKIGAQGAIWGISASQVLVAFVSFLAVHSKYTLGVGFSHIFPLDKQVILSIFKISMPAGFEQIAIQSGRMGFSLLMATAGATQFAGHNVALQIESISFMPGMAVGIAAMTLVSNNLGRGLYHRAKDYAWLSCILGATMMGFFGVLFYVFSANLTRFFIDDPAVLKWGIGCVAVSAIEQIPLAISMIIPGVLRGAGDAMTAMYVAVFGTWFIRMPMIFLLKYLGYFNVVTGWMCAFLDILVRAMLFIWILRKKNWQRIKI